MQIEYIEDWDSVESKWSWCISGTVQEMFFWLIGAMTLSMLTGIATGIFCV